MVDVGVGGVEGVDLHEGLVEVPHEGVVLGEVVGQALLKLGV